MGMTWAAIPAIIRIFIWILAAIFVLIIAGLIVHALGGGILSLHAGHFVFDIGAT